MTNHWKTLALCSISFSLGISWMAACTGEDPKDGFDALTDSALSVMTDTAHATGTPGSGCSSWQLAYFGGHPYDWPEDAAMTAAFAVGQRVYAAPFTLTDGWQFAAGTPDGFYFKRCAD